MPEFVTLEEFLKPRIPENDVCEVRDDAVESAFDEEEDDRCFDETLAAVRRFKAALDEALEIAVGNVVREVAVAVVARELSLAPAGLAAIVEDARKRFGVDRILRVRVNPLEAHLLTGLNVDVAADRALRTGDVEIDLDDGTIDATLGARLERVLS
ncbi:MAG: hypothetical protein JO199_08700 [Candidatus Eremiobacteraeota bacterium]|nr:hypothetical protein [Candidatus Eremiobacteraeota bacterium]